MSRYSNDEASLKTSRENLAVARASLYNHGLTLPGADVAYFAALTTGVGPRESFEVARRHCLMQLPPTNPDAYKDSRGQRRYPQYEIDAAIKARQESIDKIRSLPNPFQF